MSELEKLREENKALRLLLEMKDAYIDSLNKMQEAIRFSRGGYIAEIEKTKPEGVVMPGEYYFIDGVKGQSERKTVTLITNDDGTMSKTED